MVIIAFESEHENFSDYLLEELTDTLVDHELMVIDRSNLEYLRRELKFQASGDVDEESALSIGKFLGAAMAITGRMIDVGDSYRFSIQALNVETATRDSSSRFDVYSDTALRNLIDTLSRNQTVKRALDY
ncbi:CsgG/HfaB family protein [Breznakiellaceae bacterium SP9]